MGSLSPGNSRNLGGKSRCVPGSAQDVGLAQVSMGPSHIVGPTHAQISVSPAQGRRLDTSDGMVPAHDISRRPDVMDPADIPRIVNDGSVDHGRVNISDPGNIGRRRSKGIGPVP